MGLFSKLTKKNVLDELGERTTNFVVDAINELRINEWELLDEESIEKLRNHLQSNNSLYPVPKEDIEETLELLKELSENFNIYPGTIAYWVGFLRRREVAKSYASLMDKDKDIVEFSFHILNKNEYENYNDCCKYMDIFKKTEDLSKDTVGYMLMGMRKKTTYTAKLNNVGSKKLKKIVNKKFSNLGYLESSIPG